MKKIVIYGLVFIFAIGVVDYLGTEWSVAQCSWGGTVQLDKGKWKTYSSKEELLQHCKDTYRK